jgi:hypothetical protein
VNVGVTGYELFLQMVDLMGLAVGQERPQLARADHSENWVGFPGRQDSPVKGMTS